MPRHDNVVGERLPATVTLRNLTAATQELTLPCGEYVELAVRDAAGQQLYNSTHEKYGPVMPPCPRGQRILAPLETLQVTLEFVMPAAGTLQVGAARFGVRDPAVEVEITVRNP